MLAQQGAAPHQDVLATRALLAARVLAGGICACAVTGGSSAAGGGALLTVGGVAAAAAGTKHQGSDACNAGQHALTGRELQGVGGWLGAVWRAALADLARWASECASLLALFVQYKEEALLQVGRQVGSWSAP